MQHQWQLSNIRCEGCASSIRNQLAKLPNVTNIDVDLVEKCVAFEAPDHLLAQIERRLQRMGYVRIEHPEDNNGMAVARSVMSCLAGKLTQQ